MRKLTRNLFLTKESIDLLDKDINAKEFYTFFANKETGSIEVEVSITIPEEFLITEDVLATIIEGLLPAIGEREVKNKIEMVVTHLRSIGASV